jgi:threonine/homoserine/homoserine lactone efflux protein
MITVMLSMVVFALIGAISPGPVNIIATGSGASFGFLPTMPHVIGATVSYTLIVLLVGLGLNQSLTVFPEITNTLKYIGSAFLLYMSYKIATATPTPTAVGAETDVKVQQPPTLIEGALSQALNPKAWLVSMSGVSVFVSVHSQATLYLLVFCAISFTVCFVGISTWAAMGHMIGALLSTRKRQIMFNIMMGLMLSATVVSILFS